MSYASRVYRQRNVHSHDEAQNESFFTKEYAHKGHAFFQTKLSVNQPGDSYEKEADAVATSVVNKSSQTPVVQQKEINNIQRLSTSIEEEKLGTNDARMEKDKEIQEKPLQLTEMGEEKEKQEEIQKMDEPIKEDEKIQKNNVPMKEEEEKNDTGDVQAKAEAGSSPVSTQLSSQIEGSAGKGSSLPGKALHEMNSSFGADFSGVRIHQDNDAVAMNQQLQAQAFTYGHDIYFNSAKFDPHSAEGKFLLAHELTHVIQQTGSEKKAGDTGIFRFKCEAKDPCSPKLKGSKYALAWGTDTVCSKLGYPDSDLEVKPKASKSAKAKPCCNHDQVHLQDYATAQLQLDGVASCVRANQGKIAEVTHDGTAIKVQCTDVYPKGDGCNQEIELSNPASAKLNGGKADSLCPVTVTYSDPTDDKTCYSGDTGSSCISPNCRQKDTTAGETIR